jgi:hypothetical protein
MPLAAYEHRRQELVEDGEEPAQVVHESVPSILRRLDWSGHSALEQAEPEKALLTQAGSWTRFWRAMPR